MITYTEISNNKIKTAILIAVFIAVIAAFGYFFYRAYNNPGIMVIAIIFSLVSAWTSYFYSDKITLAISGAQEVDKAANPDLYNVVENLAIAGGLPTPKIYVINDPAPNAFATGRNPQHAVVCVTTGLLQIMDRSELEGVIAHELSHVGNYDIRLSTIIVVLVGILTLLGDWFFRFSFFGRRRSDNEGGGQTQAIFFAIGLVFAILAPIIAVIIQLAISRKREYLADASGALLTRYPEGLANALEKIREHQQPLAEATKATAHLFISNPFKEKSGASVGFFTGLFNTHPPLEDRIKRLREMNL